MFNGTTTKDVLSFKKIPQLLYFPVKQNPTEAKEYLIALNIIKAIEIFSAHNFVNQWWISDLTKLRRVKWENLTMEISKEQYQREENSAINSELCKWNLKKYLNNNLQLE